MGAIGGLVGFGGGAAGTSFAGPQAANIDQPTTANQATYGYERVQRGLDAQNALLAALQGQNGIGNQSQVYNQLQGTAGQFQNIANGTGPNPAQAMLNQATGQNVANQAALAAGQRGASQNVGLIARQAAQQGANLQQQAAGQAAIMQANQQIAGLQGLAGVQGQLGNLATTQAGQQIAQSNANVNAQQAEQQNLLNAIAAQNQAKVASQSSINSANAGLANTQMGGTQKLIGGLANVAGGGTYAGTSGAAYGGMMANGGPVVGPQSSIGRYLSDSVPQASEGGLVDVVVSPGEKIASPDQVQKVAQGGKAKLQTVPGKAEVKGDSYKNDKVPAKLPAGSVVVKRTRANNNPEGFIKEVLSKRGKK